MTKTAVSCLLLAALAQAGAAGAATKPIVPSFIQHLIAKRSPALAYVPTRIGPSSFRYASFTATPSRVSVTFKQTPRRKITFTATPSTRPCAAGKTKTFQMSGNKVYWAQAGGVQTAWRCVTGVRGRPVRLSASTTLDPNQYADTGLGFHVASALRIR